MPLTIMTVFAGVPRSDLLDAYVCRRAGALGNDFPNVAACRIAIEASPPSARHVRLAVAIPGDALFAEASRAAGMPQVDLYILVDRAFERIRARLTQRPSIVRAVRRPSVDAMEGVVARAG